jgi:hypothetical protein
MDTCYWMLDITSLISFLINKNYNFPKPITYFIIQICSRHAHISETIPQTPNVEIYIDENATEIHKKNVNQTNQYVAIKNKLMN